MKSALIEAAAQNLLRHPSFVAVHDVFVEQEGVCLVRSLRPHSCIAHLRRTLARRPMGHCQCVPHKCPFATMRYPHAPPALPAAHTHRSSISARGRPCWTEFRRRCAFSQAHWHSLLPSCGRKIVCQVLSPTETALGLLRQADANAARRERRKVADSAGPGVRPCPGPAPPKARTPLPYIFSHTPVPWFVLRL